MHVTIRADGNSAIGYGHLFRSGAIAEALLERGHRVRYTTTTTENVASVCPSGVAITEISSRTDAEEVRNRLEGDATDVVLVDSYVADEDYQRTIRDEVPVVLLSDDTRHPVCADVVVNGNLYAPTLEYDVLGDDPVWCLGPDYLPLRRSITARATDEPPWRDRPELALVTMGSSDSAEKTPLVLRAFDGLAMRVDAIVGPGFADEQARDVRRTAQESSVEVHPVRDPDDLPRRMFQADFAVSTASTTTYELLALGTPIVCQPVVDNQEPVAAMLDAHDAATVLDREAGEPAFRRAIQEYVADGTLRRKRRQLGRGLVDGRGAARIAAVIQDLVEP